jgi:hypothetical protein
MAHGPREPSRQLRLRVEPFEDGAMAITTQLQDGAGRQASLGIMCVRSTADAFIVRLAVRDDTKDWNDALLGGDLSPQDFDFDPDGAHASLDGNRLVGRVERVGNGASLTFAISKQELDLMMTAKSVELAGFVSMASESWTGELGGTFSMVGAPAFVGLAFKNCSSRIAVPAPQLQAVLRKPYPTYVTGDLSSVKGRSAER